MYAHVWMGEPNDSLSERKVLPYGMLYDCVKGYEQLEEVIYANFIEAGLDVADSGINALAIRRGPVLLHVEQWRAPVIGDTARYADRICRENEVHRLYYDAGGVGAGLKSYYKDWTNRPYKTRPEMFGGGVKGANTYYVTGKTNQDWFARRNAQLGWALRLRAQNTKKWLSGEEVDINQCLFISNRIPRLDEFLAQMSQPQWRETQHGKLEIVKHDENEPSPDKYDAAILAFSRDSENGLRTRAHTTRRMPDKT